MIEVEHLTFTYAGAAQPALRALSFSIREGEIFGFLGPSGAGKSTAQNIMIGLLKPYEGAVSVFERDLATWGSDYCERVGVSFERPNHCSKLTGLENLAYFRALYAGETEDPKDLLEMVGLAEEADKRVGQYSKGMMRRLNVVRALLHRPPLLFLDEPTAGLDPVNARLIKDLIRQQRERGATVFLTTHNMTVADELCDRVAFIVEGEIRLIDAPRDLKLNHGKRTVRVEYGADGQLEQREFLLEALGNDAAFLDLLRSENIQTIHSQEPTLEDIFINVTGRRLA